MYGYRAMYVCIYFILSTEGSQYTRGCTGGYLNFPVFFKETKIHEYVQEYSRYFFFCLWKIIYMSDV